MLSECQTGWTLMRCRVTWRFIRIHDVCILKVKQEVTLDLGGRGMSLFTYRPIEWLRIINKDFLYTMYTRNSMDGLEVLKDLRVNVHRE